MKLSTGGSVRVYPYNASNPTGPKRTHQETLEQAKEAAAACSKPVRLIIIIINNNCMYIDVTVHMMMIVYYMYISVLASNKIGVVNLTTNDF